MTDQERLYEQAMGELVDHMRMFKAAAPDYLGRYVKHAFFGAKRPHTSAMHPLLAKFVTEIVLDMDAARRRGLV